MNMTKNINIKTTVCISFLNVSIKVIKNRCKGNKKFKMNPNFF